MLLSTVHGSPPGGGGGVSAHGDLTGRDAEDHSKYGPLSQANTWAALQTFSAAIQVSSIKDGSGAARISLIPITPAVYFTGGVQNTGDMHITGGHLGIADAVDPRATLTIGRPFVTGSGLHSYIKYGDAAVTLDANNAFVVGLHAAPTVGFGAGTSGHIVKGLNFEVLVGLSGDASLCAGVSVRFSPVFYSGTVATWAGVDVDAINPTLGTPTITKSHGVRVRQQGHSAVGTAIGLLIEPQSGATSNYLIEAERSAGNPSLRMVAGNPPDSASATLGDSNLYLAWMENGALALRQVRWEDSGAAGGGGISANRKLLYAV
ncbi:MAG: hypothetical protein V3S20_05645 [Dehalococcoidia bacterium]